MTTAYHPQSNGEVDASAVEGGFGSPPLFCILALGAAMGFPRLRSVPFEDSGVSSTELVYGTLLSLPGQFLLTLELPLSEFLWSIVLRLPLVQCIFRQHSWRHNASFLAKRAPTCAHAFV